MEKRLLSHSAPVNLVKENSAGYLASSHVAVAELLSAEGKLQSKFLQEVSEPIRWKCSLNHVTKARVKLENRL
ncbi:hypothetical protein D4764_11G0001870 [Takifugu flavidus]|uniref:Uncharacterized protein n=1 Tax=Takifugu flavidus TaxID=433684 RepID=A0A5C6PGJ7_9TELE|nr:hypothetical protein D4764_11G0001870 [Takifugu flavidus]